MTCIVGIESDGKIYMGADSASASDWDIRETLVPKVFKKGSFLIGYTTSFRMGQIIQYHFETPSGIESGFEYMVAKYIPALRECLREHGFSKIQDNVEEGGQLLVGIGGNLYQIESDFQVNKYADGFSAIGCGAKYALGALGVMKHFADNPQTALFKALEAAARFSNGVCEPFYFEVLDGNG